MLAVLHTSDQLTNLYSEFFCHLKLRVFVLFMFRKIDTLPPMKLLTLIVGIAIGAASGYFAALKFAVKESVSPEQLTSAKAEISRLETKLKDSEASVKQLNEAKAVAAAPAEEAKPDINKLFNDAKPLLKTFTSAFEPQRKEMLKKMTEEQVKRMTELAKLTPEQAASFKAFLEQMGEGERAKWDSVLNGKGGLEQMMSMGRGPNPQKAMDEWAAANLSGEQGTQYQTARLNEKAKQITDSANTKLEAMSSSLNLDETQKDQMFNVLVRTDKNYDPTMKLEGLSTEAGAADAPQQSRDEAISAILNEDQRAKYQTQQQERKRQRGGFMKALGISGGGFPGMDEE